MSAVRVVALVPTYQHAGTLLDVVDGVLSQMDDLIVVDDGSTDDTRELLAGRSDVIVVHHDSNRGKGAALLSGFARARQEGFTHAISLDADGQHDPAQLPRFVEAIRETPGAIIIGARDMRSDNVPRRSRFGLACSNFGIRALNGLRLPDTQSGYRAYPLSPLEQLPLAPSRFELEVEVIVRAARSGVPILSIDIPVHYPPAGERISHFRPVRDFMRVLWLDCKLLLRW